jgi:Flp pilus assembly protein TadG
MGVSIESSSAHLRFVKASRGNIAVEFKLVRGVGW